MLSYLKDFMSKTLSKAQYLCEWLNGGLVLTYSKTKKRLNSEA